MTTPTLSLGVSAPGAAQIIALAKAVDSLKNNLAALANVANSTNGLARLAAEFRTMRKEMTQALAGVRTDLAEGFALMAAQVNAGADKVEAEGKKGAVKVKTAMRSISLGGDISVSASGKGLGVVGALREMQTKIKGSAEAIAAELDANTRKQIVWERQQKALWVQHKAALAQRLAEEAHMMDGAVAQFHKIQAKRLQAQIEFERHQKALWVQHKAELAVRLAEEAHMMDAAVAKFRAVQAARLQAANQNQVRIASAFAAGAYSSIVPGAGFGVVKELEKVNTEGPKATRTVYGLANSLNNAHSAARGLASGFGAMWLTWGNMAPLLAGAAISHMVSKTMSLGAEVSYNIKFMELMGDTTVETSQVIRQALRDINMETQFTLTELSKTMVQLGQAGKTQAESLQMIKPVSDLATAGMVSLDVATKLVIQAQALFGLQVKDTDKLVSQFYLTTKSGAINVEDLGGSLKYASEANTRFGQSIETSLTLLKSLGEAGIRGSSGGTVMINFMRDIAGRSGPAIAALKELRRLSKEPIKLTMMGDDGKEKMRDMIDIFEDIAKAAGKLKFEDQDRILAKLFSDRGGRQFFAMVREGHIDMQKFRQELENVDRNLASVTSKNLLTETAMGQLKMLRSAFQNSLDNVFTNVETDLINMLVNLRQIVSSTGFKDFVQGAVGAVMTLTKAVIDMRGPLLTLLEIWLGWKVLVGVTAMLTVFSNGLGALVGRFTAARMGATLMSGGMAAVGTSSIIAAGAAHGAAIGMNSVQIAALKAGTAAQTMSGSMRALAIAVGFLQNPWVGLITTLGIVASTWWMVTREGGAATKSLSDVVVKNGRVNLEQFDKEIQRLRLRNTLLGMGTSTDQFQTAHDAIVASRKRETELWADYQKVVNSPFGKETEEGQAGAARLLEKYRGQVADTAEMVKRLAAVRIQSAKDAADAEKAQFDRIKAGLAQGTITSEGGDGKVPGGGATPKTPKTLPHDETLAAIESQMRSRLQTIKIGYDNERQELEARHRGNLISEGEYQAQLLNMTTANEAQQLQNLEDNTKAWVAQWEKRRDLALKLPKGDDQNQALTNLSAEFGKFMANVEEASKGISTEGMKRQQQATIALATDTKKLSVASEEYWIKAEANVLKELHQAEVREKFADATERERAGAEAAQKVMDQYGEGVRKVKTEYEEAVQLLSDYTNGLDDATRNTDVAKLTTAGLAARVAELGNKLQLSAEQLQRLAEIARGAAIKDADNKTVKKLQKEFKEGAQKISSDLADAILEGGENGGRRLKDYLKDLFIRQPLKAVLQVILQPVGQMLQGTIMGLGGSLLGGATGGAAGGAGSSILGSVGSSLFSSMLGSSLTGTIGGTFGAGIAGGLGIGSATGYSLAGGAELAGSLFASGATAGGIGAAIGTALPWIGVAYALWSMFGDEGGGPKSEGSFGDVGANGVGVYGDQYDQQAMQTVQGLTQSFQDLATSLDIVASEFSFGLGVSTDPEGDSPSFVQATTMRNGQRVAESLDLNVGRSEAELQKAIELATARSLLSALKAADLEGQLAGYFSQLDPAKMSADQITVAIKLAQAANDVWKAFDRLGPAFANLASMSVEATASFIQFSGGLENMRANMTAFYDNFYNDAERRALTVTQISTTLTKAGIGMSEQDVLNLVANPDARRLFREWVEANAAIGESASKTVATLMSVSGALASLLPPVEAVTDAIDDTSAAFDEAAQKMKAIADERFTLEKRMYELQGKTYLVTALARAEYDASNVALFDYVTALEEAREAVNKALDAELEALDEKLSKEKETASFYKNLADSLRKYRDDLTQGDLSPLTPGQKYLEASNLFQSTYDAALGGDQDAAGRLQQVAEDFLRASQVYNASGEQYQYDFARVMSALTISIAKADETASYASQQVTLLTEQKAYLQQQVDQLFGISNAIMSLAEAMGNYQAVYNSPPSSTVQALYQNLLGRAPDPEGEMYWNLRLAQGASYQDITYGFLNSPEFRNRIQTMVDSGAVQQAWTVLKSTGLTMAELNGGMGFQSYQLEQWAQANGLPVFHGGTSMVPRTGFALLERGEAVLSRGQVNSETAALLVELREMKQLLMAQIEANDAAHERTANHIVQGTVSAKRRANFEQSNARQARALA